MVVVREAENVLGAHCQESKHLSHQNHVVDRNSAWLAFEVALVGIKLH